VSGDGREPSEAAAVFFFADLQSPVCCPGSTRVIKEGTRVERSEPREVGDIEGEWKRRSHTTIECVRPPRRAPILP